MEYPLNEHENYVFSTEGIRNRDKSNMMRKYVCPKGYIRYPLKKDGKLKWISFHRLIAKTFIPNPLNLPDVNHIDGDKFNNNVENLEWVTKRQNAKHAMDTGLAKVKLNQEKANEIRKLFSETIISRKDLAAKYGVDIKTIKDILVKKTWNY